MPSAKQKTAIVMEGYTDCLMAQQCGIANAVAALGTAFGERHLQFLRRYADRIVLVLDGDKAGQRRPTNSGNVHCRTGRPARPYPA